MKKETCDKVPLNQLFYSEPCPSLSYKPEMAYGVTELSKKRYNFLSYFEVE